MSDKEVKRLLKQVKAEGAVVTMTTSGHWLIRNPKINRSIHLPGTPSDKRWLLNAKTRLRRIGLLRGTARSEPQGHDPCR
jgi:1,2-phenylacetyl-CoA epoxidase catalytic subunit